MKDREKGKAQLIDELAGLRQRVVELEASETARKQAEEALRENTTRYQTFVSAVGHQLKTPISAVKASAEMLTEPQAESPGLRQRLISSIVQGVDSIDRLVTELMEYGKMQSVALELNRVESNLCSIVADTCALLQPLADDKRLSLQVEAPLALPRIVVDPHRVQQILFNLLSNAINFTHVGGEISVRVSRAGDHLLTQVQDNGPGIPPDRQPRLFEAFSGALDTAQGLPGSGLGLAIAKELTELHSGTIWVESQEGKGSTFSFILPISK